LKVDPQFGNVFVLLLGAILVPECGGKPTQNLTVAPVEVRSAVVPAAVKAGEPIPFEVTCGTPNPCWKFVRFDITSQEKEYLVTAYASYDGIPCIQTIGSLTAHGSVTPAGPGTYKLRFWRSRDTTLDTAVVVQ
jgi:hypothetical protein